MTAVSEQTGAWLEEFSKQKPTEGWFEEVRQAAFRRFAELGFPTTRDEEWRFTNVAPIARTTFRVASPNLRLEAPAVVKRLTLTEATRRTELERFKNPFVALNTAFLNQAAVLVPHDSVVEDPIEIVYEAPRSSEPTAVHPRTQILVGRNAQCTIIETYKGTGQYLTNAVTEIIACEGAIVDHYKVQLESPEAFHIATMYASLERSATFTSHSIALGGALVRNDTNATLSEGTEATLNGLYVVNGHQHIDNHTEIDHAKPHGTSHEVYKGILDGKATAVFNGRIIVRKDAQKTDSKQTNKNLVLSDDAVINTKPELQIFADDVRCTHGATIGQLDEESLFYMRSRGIGREQARSLLTYAFAQDILDRIKVPTLKEHLEKVLFEKFHEHGG
jgi:Fe-S cluster assembly protein SufD